jgi:hypothetical protein
MQGWFAASVLIALFVVAAAVLVRLAGQRWWDYPLIVALAAALIVPLYRVATGDISRVLPHWLWSDNADGKDQIILVSIAATFMLPLIAAALLVIAAKAIRRAATASRNDPE